MIGDLIAFVQRHGHLLMLLRQGASTLIMLVLLTAVFAPLEAFFSVRRVKFFYPGWSVNLGWYFVDALALVLVLGPIMAALALLAHTIVPSAVTQLSAGLGFWPRAGLAMVVGEVGFYWGHRLSHEIPFLWRFHAVHHSAEHVGYLVNTRAHPVDAVVQRSLGVTLLYATGLVTPGTVNGALIPSIVVFVGSVWSYFIHANIKVRLPVLDQLLSTPAFHHWHHTRDDHKDHNYASMLPVMDRIFGTYYLPRHWPEEYGTQTYMPPSVTGQLLEPFAPTRLSTAKTAETTVSG